MLVINGHMYSILKSINLTVDKPQHCMHINVMDVFTVYYIYCALY